MTAFTKSHAEQSAGTDRVERLHDLPSVTLLIGKGIQKRRNTSHTVRRLDNQSGRNRHTERHDIAKMLHGGAGNKQHQTTRQNNQQTTGKVRL